jgi:predicted MPP superfamily phosphohydrolase
MDVWAAWLLVTIGFVGHVILWTALVNRIHGLGIARCIVESLTLVCGALAVAIPAAIVWSLWTPAGWQLSILGAVYLALCALLVVWSAFVRWRWQSGSAPQCSLLENHTQVLDLRSTHGENLLAAGVVRLLGSLPGNEVLRIHVQEKELAVPQLPAALDGLRIAHLSDFHMSGRFSAEYYAAIVERVNQSRPDLVAITGDIVERAEWIDRSGIILGRLRAAGGVYFVLGNHDGKTDDARIRQVLVSAGQVDVGGRSMEITLRGEAVLIAGNELPWFPMHEQIGESPAALRLLLAHGPDQFGWAQRHGFQLMLAGHNHGGQICLPLLGAVVSPSITGTRYAGGIFREGNTLLHVSRGAASLSPLRWNCPPELALLTLRTADTRYRR